MPTTEVSEAELATLRESEARYRALLQSLDTGFCIVELSFAPDGRAEDYVFLEANPAFERQTGLVGAVGKSMRSLAPAHEEFWFETYGRIARTGAAERFEHRADALDRWYNVFAYRVDDPRHHRVAILFDNIKPQQQAEAALRESEERHAFLLRLSDALRPLKEAEDIRRSAARVLGEYLNADRAYFVDYEAAEGYGVVKHDFARVGLPSVAGQYPFEAFRKTYDRVLSGGTWVVPDAAVAAEISLEERDFYASQHVQAWVDVPFRKAGELSAILCIVQGVPRGWTAREISLIEECAERIRSEVLRARTEADLRRNEEELRIALEAGRMGIYRLNLKTGGQRWSEQQYEIFGLPKETVPTREVFMSLVEPADHEEVAFTLEDIREPGTYLDSEFRIRRPDGERRWVAAHALALFDAEGHPSELIGVNIDVTDQRKLQAAMHSSEERMREFSDASSDVMWIRRAEDLQWDFLSPAFHTIYGISRQDALRGDNFLSWQELVVPDDREMALANIEAVRRGERRTFDYRICRPEDGQIRWLRNTDFPMRDQDGSIVRIGGIGHDITPIKHAQERQQLLTAELQHRVRNTLSVIRSIARRTAESSETVEDFAMNLEGRIDAFARVQAVVTRNPAAGVDLATLLAEELRAALSNENETLTLKGPDLTLRPKPAEMLALAIHELATNAIKYGALSNVGGRISVSWTHHQDRIDFVWKERGVPPADEPARQGLGSEILLRTLPYDLGGQASMAFEPDGLRYELVVPDGILLRP